MGSFQLSSHGAAVFCFLSVLESSRAQAELQWAAPAPILWGEWEIDLSGGEPRSVKRLVYSSLHFLLPQQEPCPWSSEGEQAGQLCQEDPWTLFLSV